MWKTEYRRKIDCATRKLELSEKKLNLKKKTYKKFLLIKSKRKKWSLVLLLLTEKQIKVCEKNFKNPQKQIKEVENKLKKNKSLELF